MKTALRVLLGLAALAAAFAAVGLALPGRYRVERNTVIAERPPAVFPLVADLKAWRRWAVWFQRDPAMQIAYSPVTTGAGAWCQWASKSQGSGRMTVFSARPPSNFEYRMEFADVGMASTGAMALAPAAGGSTRVTMSNEGDLGRNPAYRWIGLFMDRMVGPDFEEGLANLKRISEAPSR